MRTKNGIQFTAKTVPSKWQEAININNEALEKLPNKNLSA